MEEVKVYTYQLEQKIVIETGSAPERTPKFGENTPFQFVDKEYK